MMDETRRSVLGLLGLGFAGLGALPLVSRPALAQLAAGEVPDISPDPLSGITSFSITESIPMIDATAMNGFVERVVAGNAETHGHVTMQMFDADDRPISLGDQLHLLIPTKNFFRAGPKFITVPNAHIVEVEMAATRNGITERTLQFRSGAAPIYHEQLK